MKNFLIIGHTGGIGAELTEILSENSKVYGTYFSRPSTSNNNISSHYLNALDEEIDVSFLPESLDGIAYCVGTIVLRPFSRLKEIDFINDFKLQVTGAVKIIQACLPKLKKSKYASIVLFSTVAVKTGFSFHSMVSASKGAIEGLTKALAAEFAPNIRINCIAPSITQTPLAGNLLNTPEKIEVNAQRHPLKRIGSPADIASMAAFLLSEKSNWITGEVFHIDGGISSIR